MKYDAIITSYPPTPPSSTLFPSPTVSPLHLIISPFPTQHHLHPNQLTLSPPLEPALKKPTMDYLLNDMNNINH